jgi:hypothetical protein
MSKLVLWFACIVCLQLQALNAGAQVITNAPQLVGLNSADGRELLPRAYQSIEPADRNMDTYLCRDQFNRYGLFHIRHGFILPCAYDEMTKEGYFYLLKSGALYGWMSYQIQNDRPVVAMQDPVFEAMKKMNGSEYLIRREGKSGIVQFLDTVRILIPVQYTEPIRHNHEQGYHLAKGDGLITVILPGETAGSVSEITGQQNSIFRDEHFVWTISYMGKTYEEVMQGTDSTRIYDVTNGRLLGTYYSDHQKRSIAEYRKYWRCIESVRWIDKRQYEVQLINPYDGTVFYRNNLDKRTRVEFDGFVTRRELDAPAEIILDQAHGKRHTLTHVGTLVGYTFVPDPTPEIEKVVYSGSTGKKPFFMPGKD